MLKTSALCDVSGFETKVAKGARSSRCRGGIQWLHAGAQGVVRNHQGVFLGVFKGVSKCFLLGGFSRTLGDLLGRFLDLVFSPDSWKL